MRSKQWYTKTSRLENSLAKSSIGVYSTQVQKPVGRKTIKRGPGKRHIDGKDFHLADEIRYIQGRAAEHNGAFVTVGSLALFSTDTGDARPWRPSRHPVGTRWRFRRCLHRGNRNAVRHRLEGRIPNRRQCFRLYRPRLRPRRHHPGLPRPTHCRMGLIGKFQICLARIRTAVQAA